MSPEDRALAEYRAAYPEDDDLPDERVRRMVMVQQRALALALVDLWHFVLDEFGRVVLRRPSGDTGVDDVPEEGSGRSDLNPFPMVRLWGRKGKR